MPLSSVSEAIDEIRAGRSVIVVDDEDRENEGDLVMAADFVTADAINFMAREARGLICVPLTGKRLDELQLPLMVADNTAPHGTAFTVSCEARGRVTTGISAADRAATVRALMDPATQPEDLLRPGHTFPLRAREGGVLRRAGQTEAAVDLARLAGAQPAGVICEIMNDDGSMARLPQLEEFATRHSLLIISVAQLISFRRRHEKLVRRVTEPVELPTENGAFQVIGYEDVTTGEQHLAIIKGDLDPEVPALVRVHSECLTGDVLGSQRCDCGEQLRNALQMIERDGGAVVYMRQHEGRGIGLHNKLRAYKLQEEGLDTVEANVQLGFPPDMRDFGVGAEILHDLGLRKIRFLTNNPDKARGIFGQSRGSERGLELVETVPLTVEPNEHNAAYLETKRTKMGHVLDFRAANERVTTFEGSLKGDDLRIAIVIGRFNDLIGERLLVGARDALRRHGVADDSVDIAWVPGSFEIPLVAQRLASSGSYDAVICLGAVIRGATAHFDYVAGQAASGIATVARETGVPVIFGVLTTETIEQAIERAGTKAGNKGYEAAVAAIEMANLMKQLPSAL